MSSVKPMSSPPTAGPRSTYRVQLHAGFGFEHAAGIAEYLKALGVTHLYCSPYLQAAAGSTHGYDIVDPRRLNAEFGGAPRHAALVGALRAAGLAQVLDIVPNHMAADAANQWWWDVLENGPASRFASFFDIDWEGQDDKSAYTVLVPILGDHYGRVLEAGELRVERSGGSFVVRYHDHRLPISPRTADALLGAAARRAGSAELAEIAEGLGALPSSRLTDDSSRNRRHERKAELADELGALCLSREAIAHAVADELGALNHDIDRLDAILRRQNYRLAFWRIASEELDYRRFFNIETLVGIRIEDPAVFAETHALILELVRDGTVDGLRVDHVDGLRDPRGYLADLARHTDGVYTVVEKILEPDEALPSSWEVAGTSGYDFLIRVNDVFVACGNEQAMTDRYTSFTGETATYEDVVHAAKQQIMTVELAAEVERATALLAAICDGHRRHRDHTRRELRTALREFVGAFPVYRTYIRPGEPATEQERRHVACAVATALARRPDLDRELLGFLGDLASGGFEASPDGEFVQRLQQLTGPVMAKGVEDTALYRYHRLVSLNEVGGNPGVFGRSAEAFHAATAAAAGAWPRTMLTLSTHDTKRSADVRARLNVLSELPEAWGEAVDRWATRNESQRRDAWPDANTEYLLYQTLIGAWPVHADRVSAFMAKATKESKVHTSWTEPVLDYDEAVETFLRRILADRSFVEDLETFLAEERIVERGRRNSLAQTTLLLTCPGVPDVYQGTELWDLSLVDPDNRRPVDYGLRRRLLDETAALAAIDVVPHMDSGAPKQWLIRRLLEHRASDPDPYESGGYEPVAITGARAEDAIAFTRGDLVVVVPRLGDGPWADTKVQVSGGAWTEVLTGRIVDSGPVRLDELFAELPAAVLRRDRA